MPGNFNRIQNSWKKILMLVIALCFFSIVSIAQNSIDIQRGGHIVPPAPVKINSPQEEYNDRLDDAQKNSEPDGYVIAYQVSFDLDFCGDLKTGTQIRSVILDKVQSCEFSEKIKQKFLRIAAGTSAAALGDLYNYFVKKKAVPNKTFSGQSCTEYLQETKERLHFESLLNAYEQSNAKLEDLHEIVPSCREGSNFFSNRPSQPVVK